MPKITFFTFCTNKVSQINLEMESAHKIGLINAILVKSEIMKFLTYLVKYENFKWATVLRGLKKLNHGFGSKLAKRYFKPC